MITTIQWFSICITLTVKYAIKYVLYGTGIAYLSFDIWDMVIGLFGLF